jgi:hypothetical protein
VSDDKMTSDSDLIFLCLFSGVIDEPSLMPFPEKGTQLEDFSGVSQLRISFMFEWLDD